MYALSHDNLLFYLKGNVRADSFENTLFSSVFQTVLIHTEKSVNITFPLMYV